MDMSDGGNDHGTMTIDGASLDSMIEAEALRQEVEEAASQSPSEEHAGRLVRAFAEWQSVGDYKSKQSKALGEKVAARKAAFAEAMATGHQTQGDQLLKLLLCEQRWQELEEAIAERKDVQASLRDQLKVTRQKIADLIQEARDRQLSLFQSGAAGDADSDSGVETDAG
jgi:hypothetical protein